MTFLRFAGCSSASLNNLAVLETTSMTAAHENDTKVPEGLSGSTHCSFSRYLWHLTVSPHSLTSPAVVAPFSAVRQLHVLQDEARCGCFCSSTEVAYIALKDGFVTQVDTLTFRTQTRLGKRDDVINAIECR